MSNNRRKPWSANNLSDEIERIREEINYIEKEKIPMMLEFLSNTDRKTRFTEQRKKSVMSELPEMRDRHKNLKIRLHKLEWDSRNIVEVIEKECKYDDCDNNKINVIQYPKDFPHYAKEECSKCGRLQTYVPFPED